VNQVTQIEGLRFAALLSILPLVLRN